MDEGRREGRGRLLGAIFPPRYDFHGMLLTQADKTMDGVNALVDWLKKGDLSVPPDELADIEKQADQTRYHMEALLLEAFSTPFDRQDIYSISRQMDNLLNFSLSTALEMKAFGVKPDEAIMDMAMALQEGTKLVVEAIKIMEKNPTAADGMIRAMRRSERRIEINYTNSLAKVFDSDDPISAIKKREVYHHLKDSGRALDITIDILHRIVVGLA